MKLWILSLIALSLLFVPSALAIGDHQAAIRALDDTGITPVDARGVQAVVSVPSSTGQTTLLDDFNRPNEYPLSGGGNWQGGIGQSGEAKLKVDANRLGCVLNTTCTARWHESMPQDQTAQATVAVKPENGNGFRLYLRVLDPVGTKKGYFLYAKRLDGQPDEWRVYAMTPGGDWLLDAYNLEYSVGDVISFSAVGNRLTTRLSHAGSWTVLGAVTNNSYVFGGKVGVGIRGTAGRLDDFGAGATSPELTMEEDDMVYSFVRIDPPEVGMVQVGWFRSEGTSEIYHPGGDCYNGGGRYEGILIEWLPAGGDGSADEYDCQYIPTPAAYTWGEPVEMQVNFIEGAGGGWDVRFDGTLYAAPDLGFTTGDALVGAENLDESAQPCHFTTEFTDMKYQVGAETDPFVLVDEDWDLYAPGENFTGELIPGSGTNFGYVVYDEGC